ncbi:hypothetical protein [Nocardiopsis alba]|uniref:hypothetical protein n=1 Tax=Nocardiopsis alba TaxID=53437 RepID=UPI0033A7108C
MRRHRTGPTPEHYPTAMIHDPNLGLSPKGVLLDLLAREDNPTLATLTAEGHARGQGETSAHFRKWLGELEKAGYLNRDPDATDDDPVATDVYDTAQR